MADQNRWEELGGRAKVDARKPKDFIEQHVMPLLHQRTRQCLGSHEIFRSERAFWRESVSLGFSSVCLEEFRLSGWFPRAPGVYWSKHGIRARQSVWGDETYHHPKLGSFYAPMSKMAFIEQGGIGTIRLRPRSVDGIDCWFATAISGMQCAGGIPLIIPARLMHLASVTWEDTVTIHGRVRFLEDVGLQDTAAAVHHASPIVVFVDEIKGVSNKRQSANRTIITPVVLFSEYEPKQGVRSSKFDDNGYSYTFVQCDASSDDDLEQAGNWIETYASMHEGHIITNYDQLSPLLAYAPLSYQRLVDKTYARTIIENLYHNGTLVANRIDHMENSMTVNVRLGDGNVIHGNLVIANSIQESFNRVQESSTNKTLKETLQSLASQLGTLIEMLDPESAENAAEALATLTKEAAREKPRREWWELSLNTIKEIATTVRDVGKPVLDTVGILAPLLAASLPR